MDLPELITCGQFHYRVTTSQEDWDTLMRERGNHFDGFYGYTWHQRELLLLNPSNAPGTMRVSLMHELMHVCAFVAGQVYKEKRSEESWVRSVAPMLLDTLVRNPQVLTYLLYQEVSVATLADGPATVPGAAR